MAVRIIKINKDSLEIESKLYIEMSNSVGFTISHYADSPKASEATLPFVIEGVKAQIPQIKDIEYSVAIRKQVDFTAIGSNGPELQNVGKDVGQKEYKNDVPNRPTVLPPGFEELYK